MPKQFEIRYRWSFLDFETRAEIFNGGWWVRLSKEGSALQSEADRLSSNTHAILAARRA